MQASHWAVGTGRHGRNVYSNENLENYLQRIILDAHSDPSPMHSKYKKISIRLTLRRGDMLAIFEAKLSSLGIGVFTKSETMESEGTQDYIIIVGGDTEDLLNTKFQMIFSTLNAFEPIHPLEIYNAMIMHGQAFSKGFDSFSRTYSYSSTLDPLEYDDLFTPAKSLAEKVISDSLSKGIISTDVTTNSKLNSLDVTSGTLLNTLAGAIHLHLVESVKSRFREIISVVLFNHILSKLSKPPSHLDFDNPEVMAIVYEDCIKPLKSFFIKSIAERIPLAFVSADFIDASFWPPSACSSKLFEEMNERMLAPSIYDEMARFGEYLLRKIMTEGLSPLPVYPSFNTSTLFMASSSFPAKTIASSATPST